MEIILGQARRRWSEDEKRALVAKTFVEGETVHGVARRHNISRSMLFCGRKQFRESLSRTPPTSTPIVLHPLRSPDLNRPRRQLRPRRLRPCRSLSLSLQAALVCILAVPPIPI